MMYTSCPVIGSAQPALAERSNVADTTVIAKAPLSSCILLVAVTFLSTLKGVGDRLFKKSTKRSVVIYVFFVDAIFKFKQFSMCESLQRRCHSNIQRRLHVIKCRCI